MLHKNSPIAVVGVSALFPGSTDAQGFWRDILAGRDLISDVPASRWLIDDHYNADPRAADKTYSKRGAFLGDVDFDAVEFGIPPSAIDATDTCQLLALIVAKQVLEDALKGQFQEIDKERASVILGVTSGQELFLEVSNRLQRPVWVKALRESGIPEDKVIEICDRISGSYVPWQENTFPGLLGNVVAGRIANRFNLGGTNCVTDAACASSLSALAMGVGELRLGNSDLVITGGADTFNDISMYVCFSKTPALSPSGDCRPFSDRADGTVLGEGLGMFALKRLEDAERDGNRIYAVIRGIGSSSDGRSKSIYAPLPEGQAKALRRCYQGAGYGPETVDLVEAHGTGTAAGDAAEFKSLHTVFSAANPAATQWCALGSVKSQVGHTKASAGAAGLFKTVMALHNKILPPTIKVDRPNPQLAIETSPFYLNTQARPWIRGADHPRRASLSSFGFGGTNFHVTLEEYTGEGNRPGLPWANSAELVLLSATSAATLAGRCRELSGSCAKPPLSATALESQLSFNPALDARLAVVCESTSDLAQKLRKAADNLDGRTNGSQNGTHAIAPGVYYGGLSNPGRIGFLFPGQGSQYAGMTAGLAMAFSCARDLWDGAPEMAARVFPLPVFSDADRDAQARDLTATEWAQPAIGVASAVFLSILRKLGLSPDCVGGHSFGEIPALYAAGSIGFETMLEASRKRGELMAAAATTPGGMLSIRHEAGKLSEWIGEWGLDLVVANHNGPKQAVLSGATSAIAEAERRFSDLGIGATRLPVSTAFHSPVVAPAADAFREFLGKCEIAEAQMPVYSNRDGLPYPQDPSAVRDRLAEQIAQPVNFHGMVDQMYEDGVRTFIEVGPGSVLTPLLKTIIGERPHHAIALDRQGAEGLPALWHGLGQIAVLGLPLDWAELRREHDVHPVASLATEPRFTIKLNGGNHGRPYPPAGGSAALPAPVVAAAAPVVAPVTVPAPSSNESVQAYQIFQDSISNAHRNWQANLAQGHESFLKSMEAAYFGMLGTPQPAVQMPLPVAPVLPVVVREAAPIFLAPPTPAPAPQIVLELVAEKTGYPVEMLESGMALEADLGIDSIKRVEIFSALAEKLPGVREFDQAAMAGMRTLGDVVRFVAGAPKAQEGQAEAPASQFVLELVAGKTGYPVEMLEPGMALEADLGIDSIKRVEIFSALAEKLPGASEFDQSTMADIRTLGDIVRFVAGAPKAPEESQAETPSSHVVLELIAEKTGYPVEMLEPGMALESDLGIDSIKRVEIFSALRDCTPGLPEQDAGRMASLRTIADVMAFVGAAPLQLSPRYVVSRCDAPATGHTMLDRADGIISITNDGCGIAAELAELLGAEGYDASVVESVPDDSRAVVCLAGLQAFESLEQAIAANHEAFQAAKSVARALTSAAGLFAIVQDTGSPLRAWAGGMAGLAKTAALEWPKARVKAIEIEMAARSPREIAQSLFDELTRGGNEIEVGLTAAGNRTTFQAVQAPAGGGHLNMGSDSVIVATGGARGVTAASLLQLAAAASPRFVLLGRTPLDNEPAFCAGQSDEASLKRAFVNDAGTRGERIEPAVVSAKTAQVLATREIRANIREMEKAGSAVRYFAVDARDRKALASALAEVRREWGPITGIVHGAGVLADKRIEDLTPEQFASVFSTKVDGLQSLLDATSADPVTVVCLFSSIAARCGNPGQGAYSAANEVLNSIARANTARFKSLNWGPWDGGMVTAGLRRHFEELGVHLLGIEEGAQLFVDELLRGSDAEVILGAAPVAPAREMRLNVSHRSHPFLADHTIKGLPVLPIVEAIDMFARAGSPRGCTDLKVLKGIRLENFTGQGDLLVVRQRSGDVYEIVDAEGTRYYEATLSPSTNAVPALSGKLDPARWDLDEIYGKLLFHGPAFQVITQVSGISEHGIAGTLNGCGRGWLDGGLQLALLWGFHKLNVLTLPLKIAGVRIEARNAVRGPIQCHVAAQLSGKNRIVCDIGFTSERGEAIASLTGVELYTAPGA